MPLFTCLGEMEILVGLHRSITQGSSNGGCVHGTAEGTSKAIEISTEQASIQT